MTHAPTFARLRLRIVRNLLGRLRTESRLKTTVITVFALGFWGLMFAMFYDVFHFLDKFEGIKAILLGYLFDFFFLSLLVMMTISNAIISYAALFRSRESEFLMALPVRRGLVFTYKSMESLFFSSWGMVAIIVPMILAYGVNAGAGPLFYAASLVFAFTFIFLPTWAGAIAALLLTVCVPRKPRNAVVLLAVLGALLAGGLGYRFYVEARGAMFDESSVRSILGRISFCQYWLLPSRWVGEGILSFARGDYRTAGFNYLLLASNVLFFGWIASNLGAMLYGRAWAASQGRTGRRFYSASSRLDRAVMRLLFPLPLNMRRLVVKDFKTFRRDPAQWSQCLLFFGLLGLYILNLPRMQAVLDQPYWRSLVAFLNLAATCLTLSTFTSRFVFPQLSLEGRRFWVLGLLPLERRTVLWGKFFFSAAGSLLISGSLIIASDLVLALPWWMVTIHLFVVLVACCGLSGLAVGLGTLYPDLRAENPSKIVSSFGGTLNLLCSIGFVGLVTGFVALPMHAMGMGLVEGPRVIIIMIATVVAELVMGALATFWPMRAAVRAFRRMEF